MTKHFKLLAAGSKLARLTVLLSKRDENSLIMLLLEQTMLQGEYFGKCWKDYGLKIRFLEQKIVSYFSAIFCLKHLSPTK